MPVLLAVPRIAGGTLDVTINDGRPLFVVGRNGSGKSGFMHWLSMRVGVPSKSISGHRSNTLTFAGSDLTIALRRQQAGFDARHQVLPDARWIEQMNTKPVSAVLFDLFAAEHLRARMYTEAGLAKDEAGKQAAEAMLSPLTELNRLLALCAIPVRMQISAQEELEVVKDHVHYTANKMSDGERNALLLTAQVLTAQPGTALLIDEPERHLHHSIMKPLTAGLIALRPDCVFVIATHDIELPTVVPGAQTLILRECAFQSDMASAWEADLLPAGAELSDDIKAAVLGGRRKVIFVEGTSASLDLPLYQLLFPSASVVPQNNCREVENAVRGVRSAAALAWVEAFGVVDNDSRPAVEFAALEANGVFPLGVNTVESVYYHPTIVRRLAERRVRFMGGNVDTILADARTRTIAAVQPRIGYLATRRAHHKVRSMIFAQLPDDGSIERGEPVAISIDTATERGAFAAELTALAGADDWGVIIERFGIKNTGATNGIARALSMSTSDYEEAVRRMIADDPDARAAARAFFGNLLAALGI